MMPGFIVFLAMLWLILTTVINWQLGLTWLIVCIVVAFIAGAIIKNGSN